MSETKNYRVHLDSATLPEKISIEAIVDTFAQAVETSPLIAAPVVSANTLLRRISLTASIAADSPAAALMGVQGPFLWGLTQIGASQVGVAEVSMEAEQPDPADSDALVDRHELLGTPELAERLGITRQRIAQMTAEEGRFPTPVTTVRGTSVWRWGDVVDWISAGNWKKAPGRPKSVEGLDDVELFLLAMPTPAPSDIGRRARIEMGRRGFAGWESGMQRGERLMRRQPPRSFSEVLDKLNNETLIAVATSSVGGEIDPMDLASEKLLARGYFFDGQTWVVDHPEMNLHGTPPVGSSRQRAG